MRSHEEYVSLPLLSISDAAKYLGVGRKVLYQLIERGEVRVVKVDGSVQVEKNSLDEYIASGRLS